MNRIFILIILFAVYMQSTILIVADGNTVTNTVTSGSNININTLRDPFWPSGWRPANFGQTNCETIITSPIRWDDAGNLLRITGLTKTINGDYLALLKGYGIVKKGDIISVRYKNLVYNWLIKDITKDGVIRKRISVSQCK